MAEPIDDLRRLATGRAGGADEGPDVHGAPRPAGHHEAASISADLVKLAASGVGVAYALLGYVYSQSYFRGFGMAITDVELSYLDMFHRGALLVTEPHVLAATVGLCVLPGLVYWLRLHHWLPRRGGPLAAGAFILGSAYLGITGGQRLGEVHAYQVWWEGSRGKPAACILDAHEVSRLAGRIADLTERGRVRLVHRSEHFTYLTRVQGERGLDRTNGEIGDVYVIPNDAVVFCSVRSADLRGPDPGAGAGPTT